jgi:hypothetical protein
MVIGAAPGIRKHCLRATVDFGVPRLADDVIVHPTEGNNMGVIKAALTARYSVAGSGRDDFMDFRARIFIGSEIAPDDVGTHTLCVFWRPIGLFISTRWY